MKEKLTNFSNFTFVIVFFFAIFDTSFSKSQGSNYRGFRVKSHLKFDQELSGIAHVIDGDSIKVDGKEIRLFGIDAPEYSQTCFDKEDEEYKCGQVSRDFLIRLIEKKHVDCLYTGKDKYDRFLSKCFINDVSINGELLRNGMAVVYNFTESDEKMDQLELSAKKQKIGIWRGTFQLPKDYRKSHPYY